MFSLSFAVWRVIESLYYFSNDILLLYFLVMKENVPHIFFSPLEKLLPDSQATWCSQTWTWNLNLNAEFPSILSNLELFLVLLLIEFLCYVSRDCDEGHSCCSIVRCTFPKIVPWKRYDYTKVTWTRIKESPLNYARILIMGEKRVSGEAEHHAQ